MIKIADTEQPSIVQLEPEPEQVTPTEQQAMPPPQQQQQQRLQSTPVTPPNQQQFLVSRTQPYQGNPQQQQQPQQQLSSQQQQQFMISSMQQQQQFIAMQPPPVNGAARPQFGQPQPYQVVQQFPHQGVGAVVLDPVAPAPQLRRYRAKTAKTLGALQISIAIISVLLGIISVAIDAWGSLIGLPMWSAICFFLPAGILGVMSAKPTNMQNCMIKSCLAMSIFAATIAGVSVVISTIACFREYHYDPNNGTHYLVGNIIMDALVAIVSFGEVVIAATQSAYCCHVRCDCCNSAPTEMARYVAPQNTRPTMVYPMQQQQQQQQQQQFMMQQRQQIVRQQQQQQQQHGNRVQNVIVPLQNAPGDAQPAHMSISGFLVTPGGGHEPALPEYSDSPPPSYSLSTGYI